METPPTPPPDYRNLALPFILIAAVFFLPYVFVIAWILSGTVRALLELVLPFSAAFDLAAGFPAAMCWLVLLISASGSVLMVRELRINPAVRRTAALLLAGDLCGIICCTVAAPLLPDPNPQKIPVVLGMIGFAALPLCLAYLLDGFGNDPAAPAASGLLRPFSKLVGLYDVVFALMLAVSMLTYVPPVPSPYTDNMFNFDPIAITGAFFGLIGLAFLVPLVGLLLIREASRIHIAALAAENAGALPAGRDSAGEPVPLPPLFVPGARLRLAAVLLLLLCIAAGGWWMYWTFADTTPGKTWTRVTDAAPVSPGGRAAAEYKGQLWILGGGNFMGDGGVGWHTADGSTWVREASPDMVPQRVGPSLVVFKDALFLIGGAGERSGELHNEVWYSGNGANWSEIQPGAGFSPRLGAGTAVFRDRVWVIGGNTGNFTSQCTSDIWSSDDGITWRQETPAAGFPPRSYPSVLVYRGRLWVIGGWADDNGGEFNDVWSSDDGIHWTQVTASAAFARNCPVSAVVFGDRLWAVQNFYVTSATEPWKMDHEQGIWTSTDGASWTKLMADPEFFRPEYTSQPPALVVFGNRLWVLQEGYGATGIWYTAGRSA